MGADLFGCLQRGAGHSTADTDNEKGFTRLEPGIGEKHSPERDKHKRESRRFFKGKPRGNSETVFRWYLYIFRVRSLQSFPENPQVATHKISAGQTELAAAPSSRGISTNRSAFFYIVSLLANFNHTPGPIRSKDVRL